MVLKGFVKSREQANSILMTGKVFIDNKRVEKPGQQVLQNSKTVSYTHLTLPTKRIV